MQETVRHHISTLEQIIPGVVGPNGEAQVSAVVIDEGLSHWWAALIRICFALFSRPDANLSPDHVREVFRDLQSQMSSMELLHRQARNIKEYDDNISGPQRSIHLATDELICELPGVEFDGGCPDPLPFGLAVEMLSNPALLFMLPGRCTVGFASIFPKLQDILEGGDSVLFQEALEGLKSVPWKEGGCWEGNVVQRQLWRFQDLCSGGGLGFTVEIFLIALKQLLSTSPWKDSQSAMYVGTFRAITSDWSVYKHSLGTQKIVLHAVASPGGLISKFNYPAYITEELLALVYNMLKEQTGPHIDHAVEQLRDSDNRCYHGPPDFRARALEVILQSRLTAPSFS